MRYVLGLAFRQPSRKEKSGKEDEFEGLQTWHFVGTAKARALAFWVSILQQRNKKKIINIDRYK